MIKNRKKLERNYVNPRFPFSFVGRNKLANHLNTSNKNINEKFLAFQNVYTLHRFARKPSHFNPYFIHKPREQIQMDLIELSRKRKYAKNNENYNYILIAIDSFSKRIWLQPMKNKSGQQSLEAIKKMLNEMGIPSPKSIVFDRGLEFTNRQVINFLKEKNITVIHPKTIVKASIVERFNSTIKNTIFKFLTNSNDSSYIKELNNFQFAYNNRPHSGIFNFSPIEAEKNENIDIIRRKYQEKRNETIMWAKNKKATFKIGDQVKIRKKTGWLQRGYKQTFSNKNYIIDSINDRLPIVLYKLKNLDSGQKIDKSFYSENLQLVK